ncbi:hypothetical protein LOAG_03435 [Loa loa]|uniref:Uncharacterized protein n=1 Tax=Loa loa TaxID=7209 RepID=A0A1I7W261_LOALO|nr:hypothetical protein LOAG_03435 [Loa loa]EFO25054.2 hypothetical protein LOAG_03435 [Loa loa]
MLNLFHYNILLILICRPCTSILDFPSDNIRRLRVLDVIGGYPNFFGAIYIHDGPNNNVLNRVRPESNRFVPFSTLLHFAIKRADCSNLTSASLKCGVICPKNDPNCTIKQQVDEEGGLLEAATMFEKGTINGYVYGDEVRTNGQLSLLRPDANGLCTHSYKQTMNYKINYTASCRWHFSVEKGCNVSDLIKFLSNQMSGTEVCDQTGGRCVVPILRDMATASSDQKCDNYSVMSARLATQQGSILGMLIEFLPSPNKCRESYCILTTKISFQEVTQRLLDRMKMSKYENSEGRFRCPSEITCLAELLYFLDTFDLGEFSAQFFVLIPLFVLLLLYVA